MKYEQWTQCAPRGAFGRTDSIYGTFDHLMLLLGRLASFAAKDLARKRRARKAQAGPPGAGGGPPPPRGPGMGRGRSPPVPGPGLMPSSGRVTVPRGFSPPREESSPSSESVDDLDFDASTAAALHEWDAIRQAFEIFRSRLGPDFDPLAPDLVPPDPTPFGLALLYRTYSIAGIWMNYYMGLIVLHRAHPSMPPVAVFAAGMAAATTGKWANEVARIAAGLHEDTTGAPSISTLVGAAFIESCFPLFVAGIQIQFLPQRHWLIRRLREIARLTGWQSARQIANGCESGWAKAAEAGRGPPYHSPPELAPLAVPRAAVSGLGPGSRRIDRKIRELEQEAEEEGGGQGGRLVLGTSEQAHYALGLLSVEQDLDRLDIEDDEAEDGGRTGGGGVLMPDGPI
ncbi:hypothetical protein C8A05DRAFT_45581 [Staphylotrichum tortipilum]|uniref:Uncharacterized protein n=1 Tax=Staphylotrichum tortipilum TaxID=2831512 RepID=A0AAN6MI91_9PEZI|nr:hypothetical protein C8A05DRAFT_45581 [Staphylotrichum longicolle]